MAIKLQQSFIARIVQDGAVAGVEIARKFLEVAPRLSAEELAALDTLVAGLSQRPESLSLLGFTTTEGASWALGNVSRMLAVNRFAK